MFNSNRKEIKGTTSSDLKNINQNFMDLWRAVFGNINFTVNKEETSSENVGLTETIGQATFTTGVFGDLKLYKIGKRVTIHGWFAFNINTYQPAYQGDSRVYITLPDEFKPSELYEMWFYTEGNIVNGVNTRCAYKFSGGNLMLYPPDGFLSGTYNLWNITYLTT